MRKQYHFRRSERGWLAWDVDRLVRLTKDLPRSEVNVADLAELDEAYWFSGGTSDATCRMIIDHARMINEADLNFPIILSSDGRLMDGMHRVGKAVLSGVTSIEAVRFELDPDPDHIGVGPDELPCEEQAADI